MRARELIFAAIAALLLVGYLAIGADLYATVGPSAGPTPTPDPVVTPRAAPSLPGTIAFVLHRDVYVLQGGFYRPLTSEGRNRQPTLSADGRTVAFAREGQIDGKAIFDGAVVNATLGFADVVSKPAVGGSETVLVEGLRARAANGFHAVSWHFAPALSPDGQRLAYLEDDGDGASDLVVLDLRTERRLQLSVGADLADATWSPDGELIATTTYNTETAGILLWNAERPGVATRLADLPEGDAYRPAFSPDGRWLVYTHRHDGSNDLRARELATDREVALTGDGRSWGGAFSPDGRQVAFLREVGGTIDLYAMELGDVLSGGSAGQARRLTNGEGIDGTSRPAWGP